MRAARKTALALALAVMTAAGTLASPRAEEAEAAPDGAALYADHCAVCHGLDREAQPGMIDLRAYAGSRAAFAALLEQGRSVMPGFSGVFSDAEREALYRYVRDDQASAEC